MIPVFTRLGGSSKFIRGQNVRVSQFVSTLRSSSCRLHNCAVLHSHKSVFLKQPTLTGNSVISSSCCFPRYSTSPKESQAGDATSCSDLDSQTKSDNNTQRDLNSARSSSVDDDAVEALTEGDQSEFTLTLTEEQLDDLSEGGNPDIIKKIQFIQLEHEVLRQEGHQVPFMPISVSKWEELVKLETPSQRQKYYRFLFKTQHSKLNELKKKEEQKKLREEYLSTRAPLEDDEYGMTYGLNRNTLFMRLRESTEFNLYHHRLIHAMRFGQPLVFDCGFAKHMKTRESKNAAYQMELAFSCNRAHRNPFNLHFCNVNPEDDVGKYLQIRMPTMWSPAFPLNVSQNSYLDLFPKEKLVYLTPHTKTELREYRHDDIYIVGGIVDKFDPRPFSLAKAKKEGLRIAKLPLDSYLKWGLGGKALTLDKMIQILLDIKDTGNWEDALRHVPRRKLVGQRSPPVEVLPREDEDEDDFDEEIRPSKGVRGAVKPPQYINRSTHKAICYDDETGQDNWRSFADPNYLLESKQKSNEIYHSRDRHLDRYSNKYTTDTVVQPQKKRFAESFSSDPRPDTNFGGPRNHRSDRTNFNTRSSQSQNNPKESQREFRSQGFSNPQQKGQTERTKESYRVSPSLRNDSRSSEVKVDVKELFRKEK